MIGQTVSRYKIVEKLGGGGMGVVYKAEDTKLGRFVALKFMPDSVAQDRKAVERFMLEARAAAALSHPHICTIHEIDEFEGVPFIAMEYLEGQNLKYAIGGKPMPIELVIEMGIQTAEALAAAHAKGITHRDIKPSNIFITQGGQIKVVDFGLAKMASDPIIHGSEDETIVADAPTQTADLTDSGTAMGTVSYMSPEQALGQDVDARTDLFSLGTVIYEMITGRQAFPGSTQAAIFDKILNRVPPTPTRLGLEVPYELEQIVAKTLEKNKVLRYQSALEVHTDLRRVRRTIESGVSTAVPAADESYFDDHQISGTAPVPTPMSGTAAVGVSGSAIGVPVAQPGAPGAQPVSGSAPVQVVESPKSRRTLWILSALLLVAVAAIVGLMMQRGGPTALGETDVLLLSDVVNTTGDPVFDGTLKQALAVKLEESPYLNVLSERKVNESLGLMGLEPNTPLTPDVARDVCNRQGIKAMVTGEIASLGNNYVITLGAEDCQSGNSLARQQIEADSKEGVLAAVGTAAVQLRQDLGESLATIERFDAPVEQATTSSLEALKNLTTAEEVRDSGREPASIPLFKRALEIDPDFALAHARLGTVYANLREWDKAVYHKTRAYELRERVSEKERLYITGHYHSTVTGELSKEIDAYQIYGQTYPREWIPPNNLGSTFNEIGWYHKAAEESQKAVNIAPDHPLPASNLADAYLNLGQVDDAKRVLDEVFAKGMSAPYLHLTQFRIAYLQGDQAGMEEAAQGMVGDPRASDLLILQAEAAAARGRLEEAEQITNQAIEAAISQGFHERTANYLALLARWEATFGAFDRAADRASAAMDTAGNRDSMPIAAIAFALAGEIEDADQLVYEMIQQFPTDTKIRSIWIPLAEAVIAQQEGDSELVLDLLSKSAPYERSNLIMLYVRGRALGILGRPDEALVEFQKIVDLKGVDPTDPIHTLARFGMARSYAAAGNTTAAREQYETFFSLMADADEGLPTVETARKEFAALN